MAHPTRRLIGRVLAALGALIILTALWESWYRIAGAPFVPAELTAWQVFTFIDIALALLSFTAAGVALLDLTGRLDRVGTIIFGLGALAIGLTVFRLVAPPAGHGVLKPEHGAGLALIGGLMIAGGGWLIARSPALYRESLDDVLGVQAALWAPAANPRSVPPPSTGRTPGA